MCRRIRVQHPGQVTVETAMFDKLLMTAVVAAMLIAALPTTLTAQDAPSSPPSGPDTGRLYEVEHGRSLYLECIGAGSPTH